MKKQEFISKAESINEVIANVLNNQPEFVSVWNNATDEQREAFRRIMVTEMTKKMLGL